MRIVVVGGAGAMGSVTTTDLVRSGVDEVRIVDADTIGADALAEQLRTDTTRVTVHPAARLAAAVAGADAVINAVSHRLNLAVMRACLAAGAHYTDLGGLFHVAIDQYELDEEFQAAGLSAALSMGAAPGLTNMLAARAVQLGRMDTVESVEIADAVIPGRVYRPDEPYAPPYAAATLVEEYTADAAQFLDGVMTFLPGASGPRTYSFPQGDVECVYTIHSEPATLSRSYADRGIQRVEWRLGLPPADHHRLLSFKAAGLMDDEPVTVEGAQVAPRAALVAALARQARRGAWTPDPDATEWFRVIVEGTASGRGVRVTSDVEVKDLPGTGVPGSSWATGVPPSIAAQLLAAGRAQRTGVAGPELMLPVEEFFEQLAGRGLSAADVVEVLAGVPR